MLIAVITIHLILKTRSRWLFGGQFSVKENRRLNFFRLDYFKSSEEKYI